MNPDALDIARRLVALPGWRWMDGVLTADGYRVAVARHPSHGLGIVTTGAGMRSHVMDLRSCLPDLDDPATGGALLVALGHDAARVKYSPSCHKQAAGTPWLADLFGSSCNSSITMHASLGRACAAVMIELAGRSNKIAPSAEIRL